MQLWKLKHAAMRVISHIDARPFDWLIAVVVIMVLYGAIPALMDKAATSYGHTAKASREAVATTSTDVCGINGVAVWVNEKSVQCHTKHGKKSGPPATIAEAR